MIIGISGKTGSGKDTLASIIKYLIFQDRLDRGGFHDIKQSFNKFLIDTPSEELLGWKVKKFADKLKDIVCLLIGCTREDLENQNFKHSPLGDEWKYLISDSFYDTIHTKESLELNEIEHLAKPYTVRELLQRVGTNAFRNRIHEDIWVNVLFSGYKPFDADENGFVTNINKETGASFTWKPLPLMENYLFPRWIITDMRFPNELKAVENRNGITIRINREPEGVDAMGLYASYRETHLSETALDNAEFDYVIENNGTIEELIEEVSKMLIKLNLIY